MRGCSKFAEPSTLIGCMQKSTVSLQIQECEYIDQTEYLVIVL